MSRGTKTIVAGVTLRSRPEACWALFFEHLGIEWQYEPRKFNVGDTTYTPDFYLPQSRMWVEVKTADYDLEEKFPKYVEATATVLADSAGLLLLSRESFHQCRSVVGRIGERKRVDTISGYPVHTALVSDPDSPSGVVAASAIFEKTGPVILDGDTTWVYPDGFHEKTTDTKPWKHPATGEIQQRYVGEPWTGIVFRRLGYLPLKVRQAYLLDHNSILESDPRNVELRQAGLAALTPARVRGIDVLLKNLNAHIVIQDGTEITWEFFDCGKSPSRKREWHLKQGRWSRAFLLHEIESFLLQTYADFGIDLPLGSLRRVSKKQPGYEGYLTKKLDSIRDM
jgi:hypothetical protein